jgi:hypothetical protein
MDGADWLRTQLTSFGCAACGQAFETGRIRVLAERDGLFFVDLACAHCGTQAVAIVTIQLDENEVPQADAAELAAFGQGLLCKRKPVSADDVLQIHAVLEDFEGDIDQLLDRLDRGAASEAR